MMNACSTSILLELQNLNGFGLYLVCSTCNHCTFVTIERVGDGIDLLSFPENLLKENSSRFKPFVVRTREGKLTIFCGCCRSGKSALRLSPVPDGTSPSQGNSDD